MDARASTETGRDIQRSHVAGIGFGVGAGALWGVVFLAPKLSPGFSPLALSAARYLIYGILSLALFLPMRSAIGSKATRRDWLILAALSLPGNLIYYLCVAGAVHRAGVAPVSLIVGLVPVTATLVGAMERGSVPLRRLALPLSMASAGALCIYLDAPKAEHGGDRATYLVGLLMAVGGLASWTAYAVGNARYLRAHPRFTSQEWSILTGVVTGALSLVLLAPPAFLLPGMVTTSPQPAAAWWRFWAISGAIALGASVLGNSFWNAASRRLPLTLAGQMIVFETVFALVYGFAYEARWPHNLEILAAVLLIGGVALAARRHT